MTWLKLDDQFPDHPKVTQAGEEAAWLYVVALCYSSRQLTDGFIHGSVLPRLVTYRQSTRLAQRLVDAGLWEEKGEGWQIHSYGDHQRSRAEVENVRAAARERRARSRKGSREPDANVAGTEPERRGRESDPPGDGAPNDSPSASEILVAGYVTDYRATHGDHDPTSAWRGQAGKAVKALLAEGADPFELSICLGVVAKESKAPSVLAHVLADYQQAGGDHADAI